MRSILRDMPKWALGATFLLILIIMFTLLIVRSTSASAAPEQPIPFSHKKMVQYGIACLYCHADATRSQVAGMPSVAKCMGCHDVIKSGSDDIQKLAEYLHSDQPVPWARVTKLPDYVNFSHEVHVNNGVNCETCHGDVGHMTETFQAVDISMGWCLDCHKQQPEAPQLIDCVECHK